MVGQSRLLNNINAYTRENFPHSVLLLGEVGCGKHTLVNEIGTKFGFEVIDISKTISLDAINEISGRAIPTIYIIDCSQITERHQNIILKFLEEPSSYAYVFLLAVNKSILLPTIINRCVSFEFDPYSRETLSQFLKDDDLNVLDVCTTPGQVLSIHSGDLAKLRELCVTIITKIGRANYPNTLSIVKKINLKDEFDKFDINVFFNVLLNTIFEVYRDGNVNDKSLELYNLVSSYKKRLRDTRLNKEYLLENMLTSLWEFMR